ncbi:MAG TPA: TonB-dependent receptor, partial [Bacteroidia bacterium]|nr:TonB-dependent receptor [Bacteroidia bacterium]
LRALVFYSDLRYRTPGGLTKTQFDANPRGARSATAAFPGATEQKAGVHNRTLYAGISHASKITSYLNHVVAVFGSFTAFENPFITNYETRDEHSGGVRTWFEAGNRTDASVHWTSQLGTEAQQTFSEISNYGNNLGAKDTLQRSDRLRAIQYFVFGRFAADIQSRWIFEAAVSVNYNGYEYESVFPEVTTPQRRNFAPQVMPRVGMSYVSADSFAFRVSVSRGYSPPTLAEIRSSDNVINTDLQPESGWNYEVGTRLGDSKQIWWMDIAVFLYRLRETIVRRVNSAGEEYFINSGSTDQPGLEFQAFVRPLPRKSKGFVRDLELTTSYAYSPFRFTNYEVGTTDYSGNPITGVPEHVVVTSVLVQLPLNLALFVQHNFTSAISLNDENTVQADPYHLVQMKISRRTTRNRFTMETFFGVDNLLDVKYSLGNDLNAAGGRFYNPAPGRNYFAGIKVAFS